MKKIVVKLTPRQVMILRVLVSYGYSNIDDINEAFDNGEDKIEIEEVAFAAIEERDLQRLSETIKLMDFEDDPTSPESV